MKTFLESYSWHHRDLDRENSNPKGSLQPWASSLVAVASFYILTVAHFLKMANYIATCWFVPRHSFVCVQTETESVINCAFVWKDLGSFTVWSPSRSFHSMVHSFLPGDKLDMLENWNNFLVFLQCDILLLKRVDLSSTESLYWVIVFFMSYFLERFFKILSYKMNNSLISLT